MKIVDVKSMVLGTAWRNLTFVQVITDEGLVGLGEVRMLNHTDALRGYLNEAVPNHVLGHDPFDIESLVQSMYRNDYARAGEIAMSAIATLEIACWDIIGQALGQPVYKLLGGAVRENIKTYANGWYTVERTPQEFHDAARRAVAKGYRALKLDPFGAGFYELERTEKIRSIALVEAVRSAVGPGTEIMIEMHGRFNPATAVEIARELEPFRPSWIEEPVPPENLAAWAEAYYILAAPHNVGGPVSTAAALHFAASTPNFKILEHFNDFAEDWVKEAAPGNPEVVDGYFALPQGPGLGLKLNEEVVREHPQQKIFFNLFAENWHRRQAVVQPPSDVGA